MLSNGHTLAIVYQQAPHSRTPPGLPLPPQHPGALAHSCNNPNFHGALPHVYSTYASWDTPEPSPRGTFAAPEGGCPTISHPTGQAGPHIPSTRSPCAGEDQEHHGRRAEPSRKLTTEALLLQSPSLPSGWNLKSSSERSYFPHSIH